MLPTKAFVVLGRVIIQCNL